MINDNVIMPIVIAVFVAAMAVHWAYFKILKIAFDKKLVDNPDARKLQKRPVPVMGGIVVFFGILAGTLTWTTIHSIICDQSDSCLLPIICGMSLMLYIGVMDDILGLTPRSRLVIEIFAMVGLIYSSGACIDTFRDMWGVGSLSWWIAVPFTVFAGVGIINSVNMIDGVNGLSSGLCITCSLLFGVVFIKTNDLPNAVLAFTTSAAIVPFFIHNVFGFKSRMFIGDAGTMVMGILLTWFVMNVLSADSHITYFTVAKGVNAIALSLAILSVPVFDTLRVMTMRIMKKKSPFSPDKTHLHHVFINVGFSHFITAMTEITIDFVIVGIWGLSVLLGVSLEWQMYIVVASSIIFVWGTYASLRYHAKRHTEILHRITAFGVRTHLGRKEWWKKITAWLDAPTGYYEVTEDEYQSHLIYKYQHLDQTVDREKDIKQVIGFMKGRAEVLVKDVLDNCGLESTVCYMTILEAIDDDKIITLKNNHLGRPEIITLSEYIQE